MYQVHTEILNKRDPVTAEEHAVIQRHTTEGQAQLIRIEGLDPLVTLVALEHHERIDGRGYPRGIKILSEYVELIAILDFFEALTHRRPTIRIFFDHQGNREPDERKIDLAAVHQIYIEQDISDGVFVDHYFKLDPNPPDKGIHL